jgi:hypothetical protein
MTPYRPSQPCDHHLDRCRSEDVQRAGVALLASGWSVPRFPRETRTTETRVKFTREAIAFTRMSTTAGELVANQKHHTSPVSGLRRSCSHLRSVTWGSIARTPTSLSLTSTVGSSSTTWLGRPPAPPSSSRTSRARDRVTRSTSVLSRAAQAMSTGPGLSSVRASERGAAFGPRAACRCLPGLSVLVSSTALTALTSTSCRVPSSWNSGPPVGSCLLSHRWCSGHAVVAKHHRSVVQEGRLSSWSRIQPRLGS